MRSAIVCAALSMRSDRFAAKKLRESVKIKLSLVGPHIFPTAMGRAIFHSLARSFRMSVLNWKLPPARPRFR